MTDYPNREHQNADNAARRRALTALDAIEQEILSLRRKLHYGGGTRIDADDAQTLMGSAARVPGHLAELGTLFDVREWNAADQADAQAELDQVPAHE